MDYFDDPEDVAGRTDRAQHQAMWRAIDNADAVALNDVLAQNPSLAVSKGGGASLPLERWVQRWVPFRDSSAWLEVGVALVARGADPSRSSFGNSPLMALALQGQRQGQGLDVLRSFYDRAQWRPSWEHDPTSMLSLAFTPSVWARQGSPKTFPVIDWVQQALAWGADEHQGVLKRVLAMVLSNAVQSADRPEGLDEASALVARRLGRPLREQLTQALWGRLPQTLSVMYERLREHEDDAALLSLLEGAVQTPEHAQVLAQALSLRLEANTPAVLNKPSTLRL